MRGWAVLKKLIQWVFRLGFFGVLALVAFLIYYHNFVVSGPRWETPFAVAHERAVKTFVDGEGFGIRRFREKEYFHERSIRLNGEVWWLQQLSLIGATEEYGARYFDKREVPRKKEIGEARYRKLKLAEADAIAELRKGEKDFVVLKEEKLSESWFVKIRVIAPILATESCLKCHEVQEGEMLGAFEYYLGREKVERGNDFAGP